MKKLIAWTLLLAMVLAVFAGCNNNDTPATAESLIGDAKSYVYNMYKDKAGKASRDFKLVGVVKVGEFSYDIAWTTDAAEENVKVGAVENGIVVVDVNEDYAGEEDLKFTMTGKLTAGEKTETIELNYFIPGVPATTGGPVWADAPTAGSSYKFALVQAERGETLFFTGEMSGYYLATSTSPVDAVDVTVEEVEGGFHLSFLKAGVKTYIDIIPRADNAAKVNVVLTEEPTAVFTWDAERKTMTAKVGEATWYLGTYGTYNTISASNVSYIEDVSKIGVSQFPAGFCALVYNFTPAEGQPVVDTPYHFALVQAERGETLYFTGEMSGYYLATSTNPANAVNVSIEEVEGGYRMFFDKAGVKTYIDIIPRADNPAKVNVVLTEAPAAVFTWDAERKTMTAAVGESTWYLGTYGTYNTISASDVSYIADVSKIGVSQFPTVFGTGSIAY